MRRTTQHRAAMAVAAALLIVGLLAILVLSPIYDFATSPPPSHLTGELLVDGNNVMVFAHATDPAKVIKHLKTRLSTNVFIQQCLNMAADSNKFNGAQLAIMRCYVTYIGNSNQHKARLCNQHDVIVDTQLIDTYNWVEAKVARAGELREEDFRTNRHCWQQQLKELDAALGREDLLMIDIRPDQFGMDAATNILKIIDGEIVPKRSFPVLEWVRRTVGIADERLDGFRNLYTCAPCDPVLPT